MADLKTDLAELIAAVEQMVADHTDYSARIRMRHALARCHDHGAELLAAVEDARRVSELEAILRVVRAMIRGRDMEYAVVDLDRPNVGLGAAIDAAMSVVAGNGAGMDNDDIVLRIEVRGIWDGWSVAKLKDGTLVNRWPPDDFRHKATADWIARYQEGGGDGG